MPKSISVHNEHSISNSQNHETCVVLIARLWTLPLLVLKASIVFHIYITWRIYLYTSIRGVVETELIVDDLTLTGEFRGMGVTLMIFDKRNTHTTIGSPLSVLIIQLL